jgi:hypothetical protein
MKKPAGHEAAGRVVSAWAVNSRHPHYRLAHRGDLKRNAFPRGENKRAPPPPCAVAGHAWAGQRIGDFLTPRAPRGEM